MSTYEIHYFDSIIAKMVRIVISMAGYVNKLSTSEHKLFDIIF